MSPSRRYLLISPCRDEAQYLRRTLDSVAAQSVRPALWVVVDDGSTDGTTAMLEEYARRLPYLRVVRRTDRGRRQVGPGVIEAFYAGLETVRLEDFDYLCKLDMDLDLPVRYFELLMQRMESDRARRDHLRQAVVRPPAERRAGVGNLWGRDVGRHDQVLSRRLLQGGSPRASISSPSASPICDRITPAKRASGPGGFAPGSDNTSWALCPSTT